MTAIVIRGGQIIMIVDVAMLRVMRFAILVSSLFLLDLFHVALLSCVVDMFPALTLPAGDSRITSLYALLPPSCLTI